LLNRHRAGHESQPALVRTAEVSGNSRRYLAIAVVALIILSGSLRIPTVNAREIYWAYPIIWRPSTGTWFIWNDQPAGGSWAVQWGTSGDVPLIAYNIGGTYGFELVIWRPSTGTWFILLSSANWNPALAMIKQWGTAGDKPLLADFDGDGHDDLIVWRPSSGTWFILKSSTNYNPASATIIQWGSGSLGDVPVVGQNGLDGDGMADPCVWRPDPGTFFCLLSSNGYNPAEPMIKQWGSGSLGDIPFLGEVEADYKADFVVWRRSTGTWFMLLSSNGYDPALAKVVQWGASIDTPLHNSWWGYITVWRPGAQATYFTLWAPGFNPSSCTIMNWGTSGDIPLVPKD
jgi:hypothetical protein